MYVKNGPGHLMGEVVRNASKPGEEDIELIDCEETPKRLGLLESEI